mmetsp:Transcript_124380/g.348354  ORF Transcript_124380/g.348354 Transcript_124380/m.348354 type:complete len:333 (-) Transcript_124380:470-1468(-)
MYVQRSKAPSGNTNTCSACLRHPRSRRDLRTLSRRRRTGLDVEGAVVPIPPCNGVGVGLAEVALVHVLELRLDLVHRLQHVAELLLEVLHGSVLDDAVAAIGLAPGAADVVDEALRPGQRLVDLVHLLAQAALLHLLELLLQPLPEEHVGEAQGPREQRRQKQRVDAHVVLEEGARDGAEEEGEPHRREHQHLPGVDADLRALQDVQPGPPAALAEEDHGHAAGRGADVRERPRDVRRAHHGPEVGGAHGVLQAAGAGGAAGGEHGVAGGVVEAHGGDEEQGVADEGRAVEGLATDMHLVLVDQQATGEGADEERGQQLRGVGGLLPTVAAV